jgi:uncharacterized YigZ family protein
MASDSYRTLAAPAEAEFKDRNSKFLGFAFPVESEDAALAYLEHLRKLHFKANHHCFAWRLGRGTDRFRANDDGEPSGTAGRPILAQIDAAQLTDVMVVVVRYFGGTLLGAAGLINAYRETAQLTITTAEIKTVVVSQNFDLTTDYARLPDLTEAIHRLRLPIISEQYTETGGLIQVAIRESEVEDKLLRLKAAFLKVSLEEALVRDWDVLLSD